MFNFINHFRGKLSFLSPTHIYRVSRPLNVLKWTHVKATLAQVSEKLKNLPLTNFELGVLHYDEGNLSDAILRFAMVNFLDPKFERSRYYLAKCYIIKQDYDKAQEQLEAALKIKPDYKEASYALMKLTQPEEVQEVPREVIEERYAHIAKTYRSVEEESEETYRTIIREFLKTVEDKNPNLEILELGCSAGLGGKILREKEVVKRLIGVDLSEYMIEKAKQKRVDNQEVYDGLVKDHAIEYLQNCKQQFDVIFVSGLLYAFRDPSAALELLFRKLKKGGSLVFIKHSPSTSEEAVHLDGQTDRFYHQSDMLIRLVQEHGLTLSHSQELTLWDDKKGELLIFTQ